MEEAAWLGVAYGWSVCVMRNANDSAFELRLLRTTKVRKLQNAKANKLSTFNSCGC